MLRPDSTGDHLALAATNTGSSRTTHFDPAALQPFRRDGCSTEGLRCAASGCMLLKSGSYRRRADTSKFPGNMSARRLPIAHSIRYPTGPSSVSPVCARAASKCSSPWNAKSPFHLVISYLSVPFTGTHRSSSRRRLCLSVGGDSAGSNSWELSYIKRISPAHFTMEAKMKFGMGIAGIMFALATVTSADAKGCLKGAAVGGAAGHYAGHHGVLGAIAGCAVGRHQANKRARMESGTTEGRGNRPNRRSPSEERL
jgi:hypothetical protein